VFHLPRGLGPGGKWSHAGMQARVSLGVPQAAADGKLPHVQGTPDTFLWPGPEQAI